MSNNEFIPSEEHLWDNVLSKPNDQEQIDHRDQGDARKEDPYLLERLQISSSEIHPGLDLDPESGMLKLEIVSEPQCTLNFFGPVLFWMRHYCTRPQPKTVFELRSRDHDPLTCVYIKRMVHLLESIQEKGAHVEMHWYYPKHDVLSKAARGAIKEGCLLPIKMIETE